MKYNIKVTLNLTKVTANKIEGEVTFIDKDTIPDSNADDLFETLENKFDNQEKTLELIEFERYCLSYGFNVSDYRKEFNSKDGKKKFRLIGFKSSNRLYPVIVQEVGTKKHYKMSTTTAKSLMYPEVFGE